MLNWLEGLLTNIWVSLHEVPYFLKQFFLFAVYDKLFWVELFFRYGKLIKQILPLSVHYYRNIRNARVLFRVICGAHACFKFIARTVMSRHVMCVGWTSAIGYIQQGYNIVYTLYSMV